MVFMIGARQEYCGSALALFDAAAVEECLDWQGACAIKGECDLRSLFRPLMLPGCTGKFSLV